MVRPLERFESRFKVEWLDDLPASVERWKTDYSSTDEVGHFRDFKESMEIAARHFVDDYDLRTAARAAIEELDAHISELESQVEHKTQPDLEKPRAAPPAALAAIFDDVDDA
jgi:hypothetical protein